MIREATLRDAPAVAGISARSRAVAMPWLPVLHTPDEDLAFFTRELRTHRAWVSVAGETVTGFAVAGDSWLHHLYIEPDLRGLGQGSELLAAVKAAYPEGLRLWVFDRNEAARSFYADRGFVELERTDGSGNEEREPDVLMVWDGQSPISERTA